MATTTSFTLNNAELIALIARLPKASHKAVDDTADAIRTFASQVAPRDTGSLSASIYVGTPDGSDYGQQASAAMSLNPNAKIVQEVRSEFVLSLSSDTPELYVDVVGVAVGHGIFQELGTRYMSAQPFLFPAIEGERSRFVSRMTGIVD